MTKGDYLNHVKREHQFHPQFKVTCSFPSCNFTSKSWASFKVHVSKKHRNKVTQNVLDEPTEYTINFDQMETNVLTTNVSSNAFQGQNDVLACITNVCMKLECKHRLHLMRLLMLF